MNRSRNPRTGTWLLTHFCPAPISESLAGDILEEYSRGRSRTWYARQILAALLFGWWSEVSSHKILALRALAVAWATALSSRYLIGKFVLPPFYPFWWSFAHRSQFIFQSTYIVIWMPSLILGGWIVGRLHRPHSLAMAVLFAVSFELWSWQFLPWTYQLLLNSFTNSRYLPYLTQGLAGLSVLPISILVGGFLSVPRGETAARRQHAGS